MMNPIAGCGIDIEEISRFTKLLPGAPDSGEFINLVYSDEEIKTNLKTLPHLTFPIAFTCKEAFFKAFGVSWINSPISWKDIEIKFENPRNLRQFSIRMHGYAAQLFERMNCTRFDASLEYSGDYALFRVILFSE